MKGKIVEVVLSVTIVVTMMFCLNAELSARSIRVDSVVLLTDGIEHGSGVIVGPSTVLTAKHVVERPGMVIKTAAGDSYATKNVRYDPDSDLALVEIDGVFKQRPMKYGRKLSIGDRIVVIGAPFDARLTGTVMHGYVMNVDYDFEPGYENLDLIDAHCGPGCSGGPVILGGRVVGVVVRGNGVLSMVVPIEELDL